MRILRVIFISIALMFLTFSFTACNLLSYFTYTLEVISIGSGTVNINPLEEYYFYGETVTLTAVPASGWEFSHWGGDATGSATQIEVDMIDNKVITATFKAAATGSLTIHSLDLSAGSSSFTLNNYGANERVVVLLFPQDDFGFTHNVGNLSTGLSPALSEKNITSLGQEQFPLWQSEFSPRNFSDFLRYKELEIQDQHQQVRDVPNRLIIKSPALGDKQEFHIVVEEEKRMATLKAMNNYALLWVTDNTTVNDSDLNYYLNAFTNFYDDLINYFGAVPNAETYPVLVGQDQRVNIVFSTMDYGGYFYAADLYSQTIYPYSNERIIFYINSEMERNYTTGTIAHEFQHMLFYNEKILAGRPGFIDDVWINEGFSQLAEDIVGYGYEQGVGTFIVEDFLDNNWQAPLLTWEGTLADYGAAYLFARYIYDRYGPGILSAVATHSDLAQQAMENYSGLSFRDLFENWAITMVGSALNWKFPAPYRFDTINLPKISGMNLEAGQGWNNWGIRGWSTGYTLIGPGNGNNLTINVTNAAVSGNYRQTIMRWSE